MNLPALPSAGGSYILILHCDRKKRIHTGALGQVALQPGFYLYTGSARGPGGLRARLGRHLRGSVKQRWHIDYLRNVAEPTGAWFTTDPDTGEHQLAEILSHTPGVQTAHRSFGSSDCNCESHLFYSPETPRLAKVLSATGAIEVVCPDTSALRPAANL